MSSESSRCRRHPSRLVVGVCASCLRERLLVLAQLQAKKAHADMSSLSFQQSPASEPSASVSGGRGNLRWRNSLQHGVENGGWKISSSGNASRYARRTKSFSEEKQVATDHSFSATKADIGQARTNKKPLWTLFNMDDVDPPMANAIHGQESARSSENKKKSRDVSVANGCKSDTQSLDTPMNSIKNAMEPNSTVENKENHRKQELLVNASRTRAASMQQPSSAEYGGWNASWLSSLFRRRRKPRQKSLQGSADTIDVREEARPSFEAGRLSSWEHVRVSSWERPRPSWEPARLSWEGLTRSDDEFAPMTAPSSFHCIHESELEGREASEMECKGRQDNGAGSHRTDSINEDYVAQNSSARASFRHEDGAAAAVVLLRAGKAGGAGVTQARIREAAAPGNEEDEARLVSLSLSSRLQMLRDASTQTTPIHATEMEEDRAYDQPQLAGAGAAGARAGPEYRAGPGYGAGARDGDGAGGWSKVWNKARIWGGAGGASKHKLKSKDGTEERDDEAIAIASAAAATGGGDHTSSSSLVDANVRDESARKDNSSCSSSSTYYSPIKSQKDESSHRRSRRSNASNFSPSNNAAIEGGLLRFYLTPLRSGGGGGARIRERERPV